MTTIRSNAPFTPVVVDKNDRWGITIAVAALAERAAIGYLHTALSTGFMPNSIGRPAYQMAGSANIQKDEVHARAIPTGPQRRATRKNEQVTRNCTIPQRNHRSALPIERWIQLCVV